MIILTDDSKKLLDVVSIYVREKKDKEDKNFFDKITKMYNSFFE